MKSVEFVGPSGIGKTTFLKELLRQRDPESTWVTGTEILEEINYERSSFLEKVLIKGGKLFGAKLTTERSYIDKIKEHDDHCSPIIEVFLHYLNKSELENWQKVRLFNYFIKITLYEKLLIMDSCTEKVVVFDEGIVVNGGIMSVLRNDEFHSVTNSKIFPKAVIFCDLNYSDYLERLQSRFLEKGERKINPLVGNISEDQLENYIVKAKENLQKKLQACKVLGVPILEIQPISTKENFLRVQEFIKQLELQVSDKIYDS